MYLVLERVATGVAIGVLQAIPLTPVINQLPVPVGAAPPVVPATVALKVKMSPRFAVGVEVVTVTSGVT